MHSVKPAAAVAIVPDDLQLITAAVYAIPIGGGGGNVVAGQMNWRDISWSISSVGVWILVEGVVSGHRAVWRDTGRCFHPDCSSRKDHCVTDDRLGIRPTGSRAAGLVSQVPL